MNYSTRKRIYFDNAATTKMDESALKEYFDVSNNYFGNPSQPYFLGTIAKRKLNEARKTIADCINAEPDEIFFTSGGTESDNWAIKCFSSHDDLKKIYISSIEHHAILNACEDERKKGANVKLLEVDNGGYLLAETLKDALEQHSKRSVAASCETGLVSVMYVNNEIGTVQNIKELAEIAHGYGFLFHTDAVQAVGHMHIDVKNDNVDFLSASAHKFNGPKGVGFLYAKKGTHLEPYHNGGSQERGLRAGTENVAGVVAMAVALKNNVDNIKENSLKIKHMENMLISELSKTNLDFLINEHVNKIPGIISISFNNKDGEMLMHRLDLKNISVSTGAACDSKNTQISHVLKAIKLKEEYAKGTIRVSIGKNNTEEEVIKFVDTIKKIIEE